MTDTKQEPKKEKELTLGQRLVGVTFNPSKNKDVDEVKQMAADLIDKIDAIKERHQDVVRWKNMAKSYIEIGCGQTVKALVV